MALRGLVSGFPGYPSKSSPPTGTLRTFRERARENRTGERKRGRRERGKMGGKKRGEKRER